MKSLKTKLNEDATPIMGMGPTTFGSDPGVVNANSPEYVPGSGDIPQSLGTSIRKKKKKKS